MRLRGDTPYVLEVNPNPCINPQDSGFIASAGVAGFSYAEIVDEILACALARGRAEARQSAPACHGALLPAEVAG